MKKKPISATLFFYVSGGVEAYREDGQALSLSSDCNIGARKADAALCQPRGFEKSHPARFSILIRLRNYQLFGPVSLKTVPCNS